MRQFIIWIGLLVFAAVASSAQQATKQPIPVTVKPLSEVVFYPEAEVPATVASLSDSKLSAEVRAKIIYVGAEVGELVEKGAVLFRLDSTDLELELRKVRANLQALDAKRKLAKRQVERALQLVEQNFVSREFLNQRQSEFEAATAEMLALQAQADSLIRDIGKCSVRAPFKGAVKTRLGQIGEYVSPGQPLINLVDQERVEVSAQIQTTQLAAFKEGAGYQFVARGLAYPLKLRVVSGVVESSEKSQEARLIFAKTPAAPGESGVLRWRSKQPYMPASLVVNRNGKLGVFVSQDGRARFIELPLAQAGRPSQTGAILLQSLVILDGRYSVNDGDTVR